MDELEPQEVRTFKCRLCGHQAEEEWLGPCPGCGKRANVLRPRATVKTKLKTLADSGDVREIARLKTPYRDVNDVINGGLALGSFTLLSGGPASGKSTLGLHLVDHAASKGERALYSSSESEEQMTLQYASRLGIENQSVLLQARVTDPWQIAAQIEAIHPALAVVDSINYLDDPGIDAEPGSPKQMTECTKILNAAAKKHRVPLVVISHMTRAGDAKVPRDVEHEIDTIISFEKYGDYADTEVVGDLFTEKQRVQLRSLRVRKNRFGALNAGPFECGLAILRQMPQDTERPGSIVPVPKAWLDEVVEKGKDGGGKSNLRRLFGGDD